MRAGASCPRDFAQAEEVRLVGDGLLALAALAAAQDQRRRGAVVQQRARRRQPAVGVDDDPDRVRPLDVAGGQARLVEGRGAGADDHRVAERPRPVQVDQRGAAVDVARIARAGGDEAVEGLAEDGDAGAGLPRSDRLGEEQLEQLAGRRAEPPQAARDVAGPPVHDHRGGTVGPGPHLLARDREGQLARAALRVDGGADRQQQAPGGVGPEDRDACRRLAGPLAPGPGRPARRRPRFVRSPPPSSPTFPGRGGE